MKKLVMTFAIVAFLLGGLSINASAQQEDVDKAKDKDKVEAAQKVVKPVNYDKLIKDYEFNINKYIAEFEKAEKAGKTSKGNFLTYQKKALEIQDQLEAAKKELSKEQLEAYLTLKETFTKALRRK